MIPEFKFPPAKNLFEIVSLKKAEQRKVQERQAEIRISLAKIGLQIYISDSCKQRAESEELTLSFGIVGDDLLNYIIHAFFEYSEFRSILVENEDEGGFLTPSKYDDLDAEDVVEQIFSPIFTSPENRDKIANWLIAELNSAGYRTTEVEGILEISWNVSTEAE